MCSIIGISMPYVTAADIILFQRILYESRIRGLHATGVSYLEDGTIQTIKEPVGADRFLEKHSFADMVEDDGSLTLIAHTRYSTSDLEFNQPIGNSMLSIVHNGVISQELPENWPKLYGPKIGVCSTKNDTELLYNTVNEGKSPLLYWPDASIAAIELWANNSIRAYRNGRRPLYVVGYDEGYIFASTADIFQRAGLKIAHKAVTPNMYYKVYRHQFSSSDSHTRSKDLQL